jgi:hypothetical protein
VTQANHYRLDTVLQLESIVSGVSQGDAIDGRGELPSTRFYLTVGSVSTMDVGWITLLREQLSDGFRDLAGAHATVVVPVSDRLISRIVAQRIPESAPIREFELTAHDGNRITIRIRLAKPAFLPPIQVALVIDQQPDLPESPVLSLALDSQAMGALAATALRFVDLLPAGIRFDGRRFRIDLKTLLERRNAADVLTCLTELKVTTTEHRVVVHARAALPPPSPLSGTHL